MSTAFSLNIQIDSTGLDRINSHTQVVTIVKAFNPPSNQAVVWLTFSPLQTNSVTWSDNYLVYASTTQTMLWEIIQLGSTQAAEGGNNYTFDGSSFQNSSSGLSPNEYKVTNNDKQSTELTLGLAQAASINGNVQNPNPVNATAVPYNESTPFTPLDEVQIFVGSGMNVGLIIPSSLINPSNSGDIVVSKPLTVDFTTNTSQTIHYDDATNKFILDS
jgi:hypothetical protein